MPSDPPVSKKPRTEEVLGGFTTEWQALSSHPEADDAVNAASAAVAAALREELGQVASAENLVILAGLGCSLGLKSGDDSKAAPRMTDLWEAFEQVEQFGAAKEKLSSELVQSKNFEYVLSDAQARLALKPDDYDLKQFVEAAESIVWARCNFVDTATNVTTHELFLRKIGRRSTRLQRAQVFTTNYDLAFERAAERSHFNVIDGFGFGNQEFDGASFDFDFVRRRQNEQLALEPNVLHLLKLHGSVDWDLTSGTVRKIQGKPTTPVLIYPSAAKYQLSYQQPYLEFMSRFQIALRQPDVGLVVVGFGFNDDHLVAPIEAALRTNIGLRAVVATPGARRDDRSDTISWIEDLIRRGDRRLTLLEGTFADLVRHFPDIPPLEERDAHMERIAQSRSGDGR